MVAAVKLAESVLTFLFLLHRSQDSIGGIVSTLWAGQSGV